MASTVRDVLLRALFEPKFHTKLLADPDAALTEYELSDDERAALRNPGPDLYKYLAPDSAKGLLMVEGPDGGTPPPPPPPTTVVVVIIVAITVFVAAVGTNNMRDQTLEKFSPLLKAISLSSGPARMDLVKTLINELTRES